MSEKIQSQLNREISGIQSSLYTLDKEREGLLELLAAKKGALQLLIQLNSMEEPVGEPQTEEH